MPRVSIGMPVKNGGNYLAGALEAIRSQTYQDFEVLISDNASSDNTAEIAEGFCKEDDRFSLHRQPKDVGAAANFNYVFHETSGELFRWGAHDDLIRPDYLSTCVAALDSSKESVLAHPNTVAIDANGQEIGVYRGVTRHPTSHKASDRLAALIGPGPVEESIIHMCFPVFGLIRREALDGTSLIANQPRSDMLLLVELALKGPFLMLEDELFLRREHQDGSVIAAENAAADFQERERLLAAWFDPTRGDRFPATVTRLGLGYARAVFRTPMSLSEKLKTIRVLAGWTRRRGRTIAGEIKIVLRERLLD